MWEVVLGVLAVVGVVLVALWLIRLPGEDDGEELAGFLTANTDEIRRQIDGR
jgi:hypothetical protein